MTAKVDFSDVEWRSVTWTMLVTLFLRAYESRSPRTILNDRAAAELVDRIDYDWPRIERTTAPRSNQYTVTLRARALDDWTGEFLTAHPDATVLHLGCGLDSRAFRLNLPARRALVRRRHARCHRNAPAGHRGANRLSHDRLVGDRGRVVRRYSHG